MKKSEEGRKLKVPEALGVNREINKLKILDELVMAIGRDKVIFASPHKKEHVTAHITEEDILDIHKTYEGKRKRYKPLAKMDIKQIESRARDRYPDLLNAVNEAEIDINNPEFKDYLFILGRDGGGILEGLSAQSKREFILDREILEDDEFRKNFIIAPLTEAPKYNFKSVSVFTKDDKFIGNLVYEDGMYFLSTIELANKIIEILGLSKIMRR